MCFFHESVYVICCLFVRNFFAFFSLPRVRRVPRCYFLLLPPLCGAGEEGEVRGGGEGTTVFSCSFRTWDVSGRRNRTHPLASALFLSRAESSARSICRALWVAPLSSPATSLLKPSATSFDFKQMSPSPASPSPSNTFLSLLLNEMPPALYTQRPS